jgi:hypothetical protein
VITLNASSATRIGETIFIGVHPFTLYTAGWRR